MMDADDYTSGRELDGIMTSNNSPGMKLNRHNSPGNVTVDTDDCEAPPLPALKERNSDFELPTAEYSDSGGNEDDTSTNSSRIDGSGSGSGNNKSRQPTEIAAKENVHVKYTKGLVFLVLTLAAAAVGFLTYWYISEEEEQDYQQQVRVSILLPFEPQ